MNAGRPGHDPGHRPLRGIPRSRAYWELKAEQMMNRLFEPEAPVELETARAAEPLPAGNTQRGAAPPAVPPAPPPTPQVAAPQPLEPVAAAPAGKPQLPWLLVAGLGGMGLVAALVSALYLSQWTRLQQALTQERNLLLLERLRSFGPASPTSAPPAPVTPPAPVLPPPTGTPQAGVAGADGLPPPPPDEPWMQQLSQLPDGAPASAPPAAAPAAPRSATSGAPVLRVPVSPALAAAARRPRPAAASGPTPVLVGVVAAPGRAASAIFQVGNLSTSAGVGETISGTGWRLRSAGADTAVIERDGEQRTLSIGNGG
ncbi:MAG: hypothetical protein VKO65_05790 [Cyanobacteriota bacterium]|nr:hypothetical protein [Cyanobacteriota bacterium]